MKNILLLAIFINLFLEANCQDKIECYCPKSKYTNVGKPDTIVYLSSGKSIMLCGYRNRDDHPNTFSEFILSVCGSNSIIDFWDATLTCKIKTKNDTLLVERIESLPTGKNFKFLSTVWTIEKIYFVGNKAVKRLSVNREIPKYNQKEINTLLEMTIRANPIQNDSTMNFAYRLFIAAISGSKDARKDFERFKQKFRIESAEYLEEYDILQRMLLQWDNETY